MDMPVTTEKEHLFGKKSFEPYILASQTQYVMPVFCIVNDNMIKSHIKVTMKWM